MYVDFLIIFLLKDKKAFVDYCKATKQLYNQECGWYPLCPTIHKIVDHIEHFMDIFPSTITTGMTSEEPQEAANKDMKRFQLDNAYQGSAQRRNLDTFHRLMDRSSPLILVHLVDKKLERRSREELPNDVQALLKKPDVNTK